MGSIVKTEIVEQKIFLIRGQKVMLDRDLAELYGVSTKRLNQQVKRNIKRFPPDFMFQLTWEEAQASRLQIVTLKKGQNIKYLPFAFTEQGVAMLSGVLNSDRAIEVNITIMRAFVKLREILGAHKDLSEKLSQLEKRMDGKDKEVRLIFQAIKQLMSEPAKPKRKIGFHA